MTTSLLPRLSVLFSSSLLLALAAGCAASSADTAERVDDIATDEAALEACGSDKYAQALAHYKNAVAWSKERLAAQYACETEYGYLWFIADEASHAVMTCGAFRDTIRTSPWAEPIRVALAQSLTLRSLTGELLVIKDSQWQNWTGTEKFFEQGLTFWARAEGAYGPAVRVEFGANGKAKWGYLHYDEATGDIDWRTQNATYKVTKIDGTEKGKRRVTVTHGGKTESFILGVDAGRQYKDAPIFTLVPESTAPGNAPKLYSLVDECSA
mgnify:CR=1 FL=1